MGERYYDAVIIGSGPNGLTAAITLAAHGLETLVLEAAPTIGGGTRTEETTLPGFLHDLCSAAHPTGFLSPVFQTLDLGRYGLRWIHAPYSAAHPLDGGRAVCLKPSITETAAQLGVDEKRYRSLIEPLSRNLEKVLSDVLQPTDLPRNPLALARFGIRGIGPALRLAKARFRSEEARALFGGCAAHSILPLDFWGTSAVGLIFLLAGHAASWPVAAGGSGAIAMALASALRERGGEIACHRRVASMADLPPARAYLFDTSPRQLSAIAGDRLPAGYLRRLERYQYGPAVFKVDYALSSQIPWLNPDCALASTVHVGGTLEEMAASERDAWEGRHSERPFVMVCQQSHFDSSRAPEGHHTGYAYCHVPFGSTRSMTDAIEGQIERFAPGFRGCILDRKVTGPADLEARNPSNTGGVITGGATLLSQLFFRPVARLDPYSTPNREIFLCSHSTPPGGGVHGMCGYNAAKSVLKRLGKRFEPLSASVASRGLGSLA